MERLPVTCYVPQTYGQLFVLLPLFGCLTFGFLSGFAIYFPELFPTHLRGTGTGFCSIARDGWPRFSSCFRAG